MGCEGTCINSITKKQEYFLGEHGYVVQELIGNGAFGQVYRIWDVKDKRFLACKVARGVVAQEILRREAALQRRISHPLFVQYADFLTYEECVMFLMEYADGESLAECLRRGRLAQGQAIGIAMQLAQGIAYLHEQSQPILYRDLKPQNICMTGDGRVRLVDLGCACVVSEAAFSRAGSPGYAPWEQLKENADEKNVLPGFYSDVYALGKLLHYMLTGDDPCKPPLRKPPIRLYDKKLSPYLERVVIQCVEERPELRLPDMSCVLRMLKLLETEGIRERAVLKKKELEAAVSSLFPGRQKQGFVYERNICCPVVKERDDFS